MAVTFFDKVASGGGGVGGVVLRPVLHAAAKVYELLVEIRNSRYDNKDGLVFKVDAPVISVGQRDYRWYRKNPCGNGYNSSIATPGVEAGGCVPRL